MDSPSLLTTQSSSPPFLSSLPLRLTTATSSVSLPKRRRFRVSILRSSVASSENSTAGTVTAADVFGGKRELSGIQPVVESLPPPLRLASSALILAGALAAGYGLGFRLGGTRNLALGGAAAMGAAGGAVVYALNACVPEVAAASLHNYVAGCDDPKMVRKEEIENIAKNYGVSKQDEAFNAELCDLYCRFVSSVIPPGREDLRGNEVATIIEFKNALGIEDPDAASMHMEIGRRIFRQRLETGDRDGDGEQRRAFQKVIYVSTLVFGDASSFLLPWKRVFKVTDSQVEIAIRDNAQRIYASTLKSLGRDVSAEQLVNLRRAQLSFRLSDEPAEDLFRQRIRTLIEEKILAALNVLKSRARTGEGISQAVKELDFILAFNEKLISLKNHADIVSFARGVGPVSLLGGEYDPDRKIDDLKLLYRTYVADALSGGRMEEHKLSALSQLRNIFGLGKKEAEAINIDVTSKVYQKRLAEAAVPGGDLDLADSKAAFLQKLCEDLRFDPQKATQIHDEIYRKKLQQCVANGELSEEDVAALLRLRVKLCIPQETVEAAHSDVCGSLFEKVVTDAISAGVDGYDRDAEKAVRKAAHGLRLTREVAMSIASKAVRKVFIVYIKRARAATKRTDAARELQKMIVFNNLVVTKLVAAIKGESSDTKLDEPEKEEKQIEDEEELLGEEWESIESLKKTKSSKKLSARNPTQREINLKDDLPEKDRIDLYRTYLMHCVTGGVVDMMLGVQVPVQKSDREYILLNQLGEILCLSPKEIVDVHRSLAEKGFRRKAEVILADGQLSKARIEQLNELQKEVGLSQEYAQKIIKSITNSKMVASIESAISRGRLSLKQIREMKETNVDLDSMISERSRENLFRKAIDELFSSGTGDFDEAEVFEKVPADLSINAEKAKEVVHQLARTRLPNLLIQAVAQLRQKNQQGAVSTLNNLLACDKAVPSDPLRWEVPEELADLYAIYAKSNPPPEKLSRLQYLLSISDAMANDLRMREDPEITVEAEEENFVF